jgi:L-ascorbate metabolism protein UlaG (beta-lactamase superfamily)
MNFLGTKILTDPALQERVGMRIVNQIVIGPRRLVPPALSVAELPPLDLILISHAHLDHLDLETLNQLPKKVTIVVPARTSNILTDSGFDNVHELDWGNSVEVNGVKITAIKVDHSGARHPWEKAEKRGYNGYLVTKSGTSVFFAGDTADTRFSPSLCGVGVDIAIMGIGGYDPFVHSHATPEQVWEMSRTLNAHYILPIHWGTFKLSEEPIEDPLRRLLAAAGNEAWRVVARGIGQTFVLPEESHHASA